MVHPGENLPAESAGDFSVEDLLPPTPETRRAFHEVVKDLPFNNTHAPATGQGWTLELAGVSTADGRSLHAMLLTGDAEYMRRAVQMQKTMFTITITSARGKRYAYSARADGVEKLSIDRPSQAVVHETHETGSITEGASDGAEVTLSGSPEIIRMLRMDRLRRMEARRLGLNDVTEGKLKELTAAIADVLANADTA